MSSIEKDQKEFKSTMFSTPKSRRTAIKNIASGMTVAALSGCVTIRKPKKIIKTYNDEPNNLIPGIPNYYATSTEQDDEVSSLLVASHEGRPTKIDGNPNCPNSLGASSATLQAEIQQLYDPDRLQSGTVANKTTSKQGILNAIKQIDLSKETIIVLNKTHSIINRTLLQKLNKKKTSIYFINSVNNDKFSSAVKDLTGSIGYADYKFQSCKFLLSFSSDFLGHNTSPKTIREFVKNQSDFDTIMFSESPTITDSKADRIINQSISEQENSLIYLTKKIVNKIGNIDERRKLQV